MEEFNPNPNQPAQPPVSPPVNQVPEGEPVLRGMPQRNRFWLAVKGVLFPLLLVVVIIGSFWLSFNLGKRILLPLKKSTVVPITVCGTEPPASIAGLQAKSLGSDEARQSKLAAVLAKKPCPPVAATVCKAKTIIPAKKVVATKLTQYYKVQAGLYKSQQNAVTYSKKLRDAGFDSFVRKVSGGWRVQAGAFKTKYQAQKLQSQLKAKGFTAIIISE